MKNNLNELGKLIIGSAIEVHKNLGPGLLESAYETCLAYELKSKGLHLERQKPLPLIYNGLKLDCAYRLDLVVEKKVIIELKCVSSLADIHLAQIITYLKLSNLQLGYLLNFNVPYLKNGIKRVVNNFIE